MKKLTLLLSLLFITFGCGVQQTRDALTSGNYDEAIQIAVENLRNRKDAKGKQDYVLFLEEAFAKAKERDLQNITLWFKDANPSNAEKIYNTYLALHNRQELIKPILPLKVLNGNRQANFIFEDYSDQIVSSKNALAKRLYDNSKALLATRDKMNFRRAYEDLKYLQQLSPGFKDADKLMEEARQKGTDYVSVYTKNETNMVIPIRLENDLLDFSTFGLNDPWTVYHSNRIKGVTYDYGIIVNFRNIAISPEQMKEKEFVKEKQVKVGQKKALDANGNPIKDQQGNFVMVDDMRTVTATIYEFRQLKSVQVTAKIDYIDFKNNQLLDTFPLSSEFVFEHIYAKYKGNKQACESNYLPYFENVAVPFPSNEQMVADSGQSVKNKLKEIISQHRIRK
ncbi:hypothetical protein [Flavobacterium stagni]|uniref:Lipoprotein n=1 Tax=Flavobacterium stagni TaxID=2506421 RepID=A0A4Q1K7F7_9FLAO|nr:hypothetical protein [Flavobacterium stagni]RXR21571.1 hypothetical protein EQG61_11195 [Flavobacterium stagni]